MRKKYKGRSERKRKEREREKDRQRNGKNNRSKERGAYIESNAQKGRERGSRERLKEVGGPLDWGHIIHQYRLWSLYTLVQEVFEASYVCQCVSEC